MSKASIGGQYALTSEYVALNTLLGLTAGILGNVELSIEPSHAATAYIKLSDAANPVQVAASVGYTHEFSALDLSSVSVKGTTGDNVVIVGEQVESLQGIMRS